MNYAGVEDVERIRQTRQHSWYKILPTIRQDSVYVPLRISMKLESVTVVFFLEVLGLAKMVSSLCLVRNTAEPSLYWYQCSMSNDYLADVEAAPVDVPRMSFSDSKIKVIRHMSFARLGNGLKVLQIHFSEIGELEDSAFGGLVELRRLEIVESNLQLVKGVWFEGLLNLETVSLRGNEIKRIEDSFFPIVSPLKTLDISENELTCLPVTSFTHFETEELHLRHNIFSWECTAPLVDWLKKKGIRYDDFERNNWDSSTDFISECQNILQKTYIHLSEENLKKCAERRALQLLPPEASYTVDEVCQFLVNTSSTFFNCSK